jgi:hypothetical protein
MSDQTDKQDAKDQAKQDAKDAKEGKAPPHPSELHQDKGLAERGIYQPFERTTSAPRPGGFDEESEELAEYRKNLAHLPPVPSESAGAASQAK